MPTLTLHDETTTGTTREAITLEFPTETITVRELIRERVYQEVQDYNRHQAASEDAIFRGLVQPTDYERTLNGDARAKTAQARRREIDWKRQYEAAVMGFESSRILVLVDDVQAESLDTQVQITRGTNVTFLQLVPLVGG